MLRSQVRFEQSGVTPGQLSSYTYAEAGMLFVNKVERKEDRPLGRRSNGGEGTPNCRLRTVRRAL